MRYSLAFTALVGLAAATPSPQVFDFNLIEDAPSPTATVAPLTAVSDTVTVTGAVETSAASAAVTTVATGINKRGAASSTGTATTSSDSSCPTQPEAGTYCGFINPEDSCAKQPDGMLHHCETSNDWAHPLQATVPSQRQTLFHLLWLIPNGRKTLLGPRLLLAMLKRSRT